MEFEFIKFSMFFDTISQDLRKYADNNLFNRNFCC